jgi:hypothetical protein
MAAHRFAHVRRDTPTDASPSTQVQQPRTPQASAAYKRQMERDGHLTCWRCTRLIPRGARWHVGHDDNQLDLIRGPEHAACNVKAAGRKGARIVNRARRRPRPHAL